MKVCSACGEEKALSEFYKAKRLKDGYQSACKSCHKKLNKNHYSENKEAYIQRAVTQHDEVRELAQFIREESGCSVCGITGWWRLAFHHTDPAQKEIEVARIRSLPALKVELAKCIIVCHNCHADIHHGSLV